jgi:hypothetical protein
MGDYLLRVTLVYTVGLGAKSIYGALRLPFNVTMLVGQPQGIAPTAYRLYVGRRRPE